MRLSLGSHFSSYHCDSFQRTDKSKECPPPWKKKKTNNISFSLSMCRMGSLLGMELTNGLPWKEVAFRMVWFSLFPQCFEDCALPPRPASLYGSAVIPRLQWSWRPEERHNALFHELWLWPQSSVMLEEEPWWSVTQEIPDFLSEAFETGRCSEPRFYLPHSGRRPHSPGHLPSADPVCLPPAHILEALDFQLHHQNLFTLSLHPSPSPSPLSIFHSLQHSAQATDLTWSRPREQGTVRTQGSEGVCLQLP